jgi:hypothetical protein
VSPAPLRTDLSLVGMIGTPGSSGSSSAATPPSANLDADHDEDVPLRYRHLTDILGTESPPGQATRVLQEELMLVRGEEPTTYSQAESDEPW